MGAVVSQARGTTHPARPAGDSAALAAHFTGRRVLVTGHTGFKGSWLALWLTRLGARVRGYALPAQDANAHFTLARLHTLVEHQEGDIRDDEALARCFAEFQPELVFHLAAQPLVRAAYHDPRDTFDTNVAGSVNVLEACRQSQSLRSLIYVTSDKCYRNRDWTWGYRENDELGGDEPYSASKAAAEIVFAAYCQTYFRQRPQLGAASVRAGNVIGGGDWAADRIVPDCIRALGAGQPVCLRNPEATRPWQHVLDPLHGYLCLAARLLQAPDAFSGAWNFGPLSGAAPSVLELTREILRHWGGGALEVLSKGEHAPEAQRLQLCSEKAQRLLHWQARWDAEAAIAHTVSWYRAVLLEGEDALRCSSRQIERYMESA